MATYQGAFDGRMPARTMDVSAVDVLASVVGYVSTVLFVGSISVVGYVSTVLFVGSIATFLVFAVTFGVREVISWAY